MGDFRMFSLNVRDLSNFKKRRAIFTWCRKQNANIIFLQETHSTDNENGAHLWSLPMGVVIREVLQYSFGDGLTAKSSKN